MKDRETQAGYDLESAYWTGNLYEVEDELEELDTRNVTVFYGNNSLGWAA